jgi:hypothetical protein
MLESQRRLVEYWELRSEQCSHTDPKVRSCLTDAFRSANAADEEIKYWRHVGRGSVTRILQLWKQKETQTASISFSNLD